jgi:hypothetical protein
VTVKSVQTGLSRSIQTSSTGNYRISNLPIGNYELRAEGAGFAPLLIQQIHLDVGQEAVIDPVLQVEGVTEAVEIVAAAQTIETTTGAVSGLVDDLQIQELPVNARSIEQLAFLQPGVNYQNTAGEAGRQAGTAVLFGAGPRISVSGTRGNQSTMLMDGINISGFWNRGPDTVSGYQLGMEAIQEFSILTSNYGAEFGRAAGGVVNIVTRSGNNALHGSLFMFHRNSVFDAKNFFDLPDADIPPFRRHQFGGSVGGPIKRDKLFFFATYEGLRESLGITRTFFVPNELARQGFLPNPDGTLRTVAVHPAIPPYLALYPLPNGPDVGGGLAEFTASDNQAIHDDLFQGRVDYRHSDTLSYFGRYTIESGSRESPFEGGPVTGLKAPMNSRNQFLALEETRIFSPTLLNVLRVGYSRNNLFGAALDARPELMFIPGRPEGMLDVGGGLPRLGCLPCVPVHTILNSYEISDHLSYTRGKHALKFGGTVTNLRSFSDFGWLFNGQFRFANLETFLRNIPLNLRGALPGGNSQAHWRITLFGLYAQDDYKIHPRLTLNLGYRYEFHTMPIEADGKISAIVDFPTATGFSVVEHPWAVNPSLKNFGPRFGFAWDMFGDAKTSLRGGYGVYNEHALQNALAVASASTPPFATSFVKLNPRFPDEVTGGFINLSPILPSVSEGTNFNLADRAPYVAQFNLTFEQQLAKSTIMSIGYAGARGFHLWGGRELNTPIPQILPDGTKFTPAGSPRRNPNFSNVTLFETSVPSWYNALQASVRRNFSSGLQFQVNYTWSKTMDDHNVLFITDTSGGVTGAGGWQDPDCRVCDRGLSVTHQEHNLKFNYIYDLPFGAGRRFGNGWSGLTQQLLGDWQLNGIGLFGSGRPFDVNLGFAFDRANTLRAGNFLETRPNWAPGYTGNPTSGVSVGCPGVPAGTPLGTPSLYFDPCAFALQPAGFFGDVPRNALIGPGLATFDLGLTKNFVISEETRLQFRAEAFNLLNRANFAVPSLGGGAAVFTNPSGLPNPTAGRILSTVTPARQLQFGLKLVF